MTKILCNVWTAYIYKRKSGRTYIDFTAQLQIYNENALKSKLSLQEVIECATRTITQHQQNNMIVVRSKS